MTPLQLTDIEIAECKKAIELLGDSAPPLVRKVMEAHLLLLSNDWMRLQHQWETKWSVGGWRVLSCGVPVPGKFFSSPADAVFAADAWSRSIQGE